MSAAIADNQRLCVSDVVACELVCVLESAYSFSRKEIAGVIRKLIHACHVTLRSTSKITRAADGYGTGRGGFADYLIRAVAWDAGCEAVVTFDRKLHKEPNFRSP